MGISTTLGKYELRQQVGAGAMGTVYEGWDPFIKRRVAIKTVPLPQSADAEIEEAIARFRQEAQAAGRLVHPNIVTIFDYGESDGVAFIVMEFVDGVTLKTMLNSGKPFSIPTIVGILDDLLSGLQFIHDHNVVHRDIKPDNVMMTQSGRAKITDFGIARIDSSNLTRTNTILGTPAFMSPEQFMGEKIDGRSDIYSVGVLLFNLLTGVRPFQGHASAIMHQVLYTNPLLPSQLSAASPASLDGIVRKAMAKRPDDRFQRAADFAVAIRLAASSQRWTPEHDGEPTVAAVKIAAPPPPSGTGPVPKSSQRRIRWVTVTAVLLLIGGGAGAGFWLHGSSPMAPRVEPSTAVPPVEDQAAQWAAAEEVASAAAKKATEEKVAAEAARKAAEERTAAEAAQRAAVEKAVADAAAKQAADEASRRAADEAAKRAAADRAAREAAAKAAKKTAEDSAAAEAARRAAEARAAAVARLTALATAVKPPDSPQANSPERNGASLSPVPRKCTVVGSRGGETASGSAIFLTIDKNGGPCRTSYTHNSKPYNVIRLTEPPKHGTIIITGSSLAYTPEARYVGSDTFRIECDPSARFVGFVTVVETGS